MKKKYKIAIIIIGAVLMGNALFVIYKKNNYNSNKLETKEVKSEVKKELLKIGFITDAHCYAKFEDEINQWELNWRCEKSLNAFAEEMNNSFKPDFVIEDGDFVDGRDDRSRDTFLEAKNLFDQVSAPKYHVLGNHETRGFIKQEWLGMVGYEKPYYYFDKKGYRIIVLDGNNRPASEGEGFVDTTPENEFYPGVIDTEQMKWLEQLLDKSKDYEKLVFVHQPLIIEENKTQEQLFIGGKELRKLFSKNDVVAVFSGHTERFCNLNEDGVSYYVLQGFWKPNRGLKKEYQFKDESVFSEISVKDKNVDVTVYHNPERNDEDGEGDYETFKLTPENGNCFDGKKLDDDDGMGKVLESD